MDTEVPAVCSPSWEGFLLVLISIQANGDFSLILSFVELHSREVSLCSPVLDHTRWADLSTGKGMVSSVTYNPNAPLEWGMPQVVGDPSANREASQSWVSPDQREEQS